MVKSPTHDHVVLADGIGLDIGDGPLDAVHIQLEALPCHLNNRHYPVLSVAYLHQHTCMSPVSSAEDEIDAGHEVAGPMGPAGTVPQPPVDRRARQCTRATGWRAGVQGCGPTVTIVIVSGSGPWTR